MLTPPELIALARSHGVEADDAAILASLEGGWLLEPAPDGPHQVGGEPPNWVGDVPVDDAGDPLDFIACIDGAQLPPVPIAAGGVAPPVVPAHPLWIFAAVVEEESSGRAVVVGSPAEAATPHVPARTPPSEEGLWELGDYLRLGPHPLRAIPHASVRAHPDADRAWQAFAHAAKVGGRPAGTPDPWLVGGVPALIQDDVRSRAARSRRGSGGGPSDPEGWTVLLDLRERRDIAIADAGSLSVLVPTEDLARGVFEHASWVVTTH
jgi:hypothetical protein